MAPDVSVQTHALTRRFGGFTAVDGVSLSVRRGEVFGFLGANGAGKTTMIRMLCGLLLPSSGTGSVAGFDIFAQSERIKRVIGYMSQKFSLYQNLTVQENLRFYGGIYGVGKHELAPRVQETMRRLHLETERKRRTSDLPVGVRQRLALGCAVLHDPAVIFLDEPTSGVDPQVRRQFWDIIYGMASAGKTVFVTTHFMDEAEYCHRVSIMRAGRVIALDRPAALKQQHGLATMQQVFISLVNDHKEAGA